MYNIIPLLLILISLSIIIVIVVKKFSVLANLDVSSIPAEKEAKFKERILSNRLKRNIIKWSSKFSRLTAPLTRAAVNFFKAKFDQLYQLRNDYRTKEADEPADHGQKTGQLFAQAEEFKKRGDLDAAENKYIEIIGHDSKNIRAFKELGWVYFEKKQLEEAGQTYEHVLKLKENDEGDGDVYFNLAEVYRAMNKLPEAAGSLKKALKIEPANPRYLDSLLEISIIIRDKALALDAYGKLVKANPENQKLDEFKKQIDKV